jgi:hypothetical protein
LASKLIRRFLSGEITSDDLESDWPSSKTDRAIEAVGSMVWHFYDDFRPRRMVGKQVALEEERVLLERYAAFLESNEPYVWPRTNFIRLGGLGLLVPLTLWLLKPIDLWLKARNRRLDAEMDAHGDWTVWPFQSRSAWSGEPMPPFHRD